MLVPFADQVTGAAWRASLEARSVLALARAGMVGPDRPDRTAQVLLALRRFGPFGAIPAIAAVKHPGATAIADEQGTLTFAALEEQVRRLAGAWSSRGVGPGTTVGILCRNHRVPLVAAFAASRLGTDVVWLNTAFSARQAKEVAEREGVGLLVHDDEFAEAVADVELSRGRLVADQGAAYARLLAAGSPAPSPKPPRTGRIILLTSGTTGTPKGAPRPEPRSLTIPGALLERIPLRTGGATVVGPPLYHGTGLLLALLSLGLGKTLVLRRTFTAEGLLEDLARHRADAACVVPVMLQRLLALGPQAIAARDLSALKVVFCAGSQLPTEVAQRASEVLGDVLYNLYGSTEVSVVSLATPKDVREAPHAVGRPALGVRLRILDDDGREVPKGEVGRVFVGTTSPFEGYTGGGSKEVVDGLLSTGDLGHLDAAGRLCIDGRDDDMVVSGGENVFPREVEDLLLAHPAVADAAVLGVEDEEFGQRLRAFVVRAGDRALDEDAVKAHVKEHLARFKVPRDVVFVDELPRNPTGKVLKRELRASA